MYCQLLYLSLVGNSLLAISTSNASGCEPCLLAILILATRCKHTSISMDSAKDEIVTFQSTWHCAAIAIIINWPGPSMASSCFVLWISDTAFDLRNSPHFEAKVLTVIQVTYFYPTRLVAKPPAGWVLRLLWITCVYIKK